MIIELSKNIYWNTDSTKQEAETSEWISTNILSKLGVSNSREGLISPEFDKFSRPYKWIYRTEDYTIEVIREYIHPLKWAKKCDNIKVYTNE